MQGEQQGVQQDSQASENDVEIGHRTSKVRLRRRHFSPLAFPSFSPSLALQLLAIDHVLTNSTPTDCSAPWLTEVDRRGSRKAKQAEDNDRTVLVSLQHRTREHTATSRRAERQPGRGKGGPRIWLEGDERRSMGSGRGCVFRSWRFRDGTDWDVGLQ